ncbi:MAG: hypothetical protein SPL99_10955 [Catonella sp.]|nr:hypothetical protein [Catonella sp.]MDY6356956.1 hypothetical protein [Catonella sp.]
MYKDGERANLKNGMAMQAKIITGKIVDNGFYEVYVNAKARDGSDVSELMGVFTDDSSYSSKFPITSETKKHYKSDEGGIEAMCDIMQQLIDESNEEVRTEGEIFGTVKTMRKYNFTEEQIIDSIESDYNLTPEQARTYLAENTDKYKAKMLNSYK